MLTGDVLYYLVPSGERLRMFDRDMSAEYARSASESGDELVVWLCTNWDRQRRYFLGGHEVPRSHPTCVACFGEVQS